jgi:hypothetical protein
VCDKKKIIHAACLEHRDNIWIERVEGKKSIRNKIKVLQEGAGA